MNPKEIHFDPLQMSAIELRIYQNNEIREELADPNDIRALMDLIVADVGILQNVNMEG